MLSICIPTYNYDISSLVKDIIKQAEMSGTVFEIIIVNDGSTIPSESVILPEFVAHERVNYILNKENIGRTAARNLLAQKAIYDWILFLDADVALKRDNFISKFTPYLSESHKIIFGGVTYENVQPPNEQILRWKYGRNRESLPVSKRNKKPYFIISQNLLIRKETFKQLNDKLENQYGLDLYFSQQIKSKNIDVLHIDNPVIHRGLETSKHFIDKGISAVKTLITLEKSRNIDFDLTPLQRAYIRLKKIKMLAIFKAIILKSNNAILKNLNGKRPSLFLYDIYRLYNYSILKKRYE